VGYTFQNPDHQIFEPSTRQEISFGPRNLGLSEQEIAERVAEALAAFGLETYADTPPAVLGFGLRRKVSVASVYAMRPRVFVLDEPTAGLDWQSASDLMALVDDLHRNGHTIILVTHDMRIVAAHTRHMAIVQDGIVVAHGPTRAVFGRTEILDRAQLEPPQVTRLGQHLTTRGMASDLLSVSEFVDQYARVREERS